ncbi:MAG TPA: hypothetical protein PK514_10220 [Spirochaetota bacterium]|nr:hypothetical protein [Spirochaetota bacterium]
MKKAAAVFIISLLCASCGKLHGEFAFRQKDDKGYKHLLPRLEFDASETVDWIYKFDVVTGKRTIGIILMKKELGWVDIMTSADYVDETRQLVYGKISGLEPGDYKLVLTEIKTEKSVLIDQKEFYLYSDEEPLEEPLD